MDAKQFLEEFGHIASAPGGVQRLKEMIYYLAINGNLVSINTLQDATTLLEAIKLQKKNHKDSKKVVPCQKPVSENEIVVPKNWVKCRLGDLVLTITGGGTPSKSNPLYWDGDIPWASVKDLGNEKFLLSTRDKITSKGLINSSSNLIPENRVIISTRMGLGKIVINSIPVTINQDLKALELPSEVNIDFFFILYRTRSIIGKGTTVSGIRQDQLLELLAVLPPLEEQKRIVTKVNELMKLCDKLEAQQQKRNKLKKLTCTTLLNVLANAQSPYELKIAWQRVQEHISLLFDKPEDVQGLRNLILDVAIKGLLVTQDITERPASELKEEILVTKTMLLQNNEINKQPKFTEIDEDDKPFSEPEGWIFVRLGEIANKIGSGSTPRGGKSVYINKGIPFLRSQNIWNHGLRLHDVAYIAKETHKKMANTVVLPKDILLNITGASLGRCALLPDDFDEANVSQHVTIIRPTDPETREYLHLCMLSPYTQQMIWGRQVGMAREGLSKKVLEQFELPFPPLEEQKRIVAKVKSMMLLCDGLENQMVQKQSIAQNFSQAAIASLTQADTKKTEVA